MRSNVPWYTIENLHTVDSPSIAIYKSNLEYNIDNIIDLVNGNKERLLLHVKTNKMPNVIKCLIQKGIMRFKAATIAEAEMAAMEGAAQVVIAHQLVGPKLERFIKLINQYKHTEFSTIVDNEFTASELDNLAKQNDLHIPVYIDINNGMNRSGIELNNDLNKLIDVITSSAHLLFKGFHVYDGHIRDTDYQNRKARVEKALDPVYSFFKKVQASNPNISLICGGTPSFTSHVKEKDRMLSPGTCVLWDWGYQSILQEQTFKFAALIITRVISKPTRGIITIDLGHKSVASENPIDKRVKFLNLEHYKLVSQSEEHGVLEVNNWEDIKIGDLFYGIPYHVCPTINLYQQAYLIDKHSNVDTWKVLGGTRKISI